MRVSFQKPSHRRGECSTTCHTLARSPGSRILATNAQVPADPPQPLSKSRHVVTCYDFHSQLIEYSQAQEWQQKLVADLLTEPKPESLGSVLLLQHPHVITLGAGSTETNLLFDPADPPHPLVRTERGGEVTYHGPGQLVMYPILNLQLLKLDLHWYLRSLEEVVIRALKAVADISAERHDGLTGVWVGGSKIAAMGIRVRRWVTYHGLALNVTTDLDPYKHIIPCGISNKPVTSVAALMSKEEKNCCNANALLREHSEALLASFQEVFNCKIETAR